MSTHVVAVAVVVTVAVKTFFVLVAVLQVVSANRSGGVAEVEDLHCAVLGVCLCDCGGDGRARRGACGSCRERAGGRSGGKQEDYQVMHVCLLVTRRGAE